MSVRGGPLVIVSARCKENCSLVLCDCGRMFMSVWLYLQLSARVGLMQSNLSQFAHLTQALNGNKEQWLRFRCKTIRCSKSNTFFYAEQFTPVERAIFSSYFFQKFGFLFAKHVTISSKLKSESLSGRLDNSVTGISCPYSSSRVGLARKSCWFNR